MPFSQQLEAYIDEIGCTPTELARVAGISPSTMSRYLAGKRAPRPHGATFEHLCSGISDLSSGRLSAEEVSRSLMVDAPFEPIDPDAFPRALRALLDAPGISGNRLAHALGFDPSYISRICSGQRMPQNTRAFVMGTARFIARSCGDARGIEGLSTLLGVPPGGLKTYEQRFAAASTFLGIPEEDARHEEQSGGVVASFLSSLDSFDLNDYLANVHFDDIRVPTVPFSIPTVKTYTGIEQMKQAELDFLRAAALSRSTDDVILFSDMPLEEMGADKEFAKSVMMGIAVLVRKGIHLSNIHDIHRPLDEIFMGLEAWIPLYMTGQLSSYYLPEPTNQVFLHFIRSAGTVAAAGEAIAGHQAAGRYVVSKRADDVAYYRTRATQILGHALPLLSVFGDGDEAALGERLRELGAGASERTVSVGEGVFSNIAITVLPGRYALITKEGSPRVRLLTELPVLIDALLEFHPVLFSREDRS